MKHKDIKPGMKVVPHSKTAHPWPGLRLSKIWADAKRKNQPFLYVIRYEASIDIRAWVLSDERNPLKGGGDYFMARDFNPYMEESNG